MATGDEVGERKEKRREEEDRSENILEGEREEGKEGGASNCGRWHLQKERGRGRAGKAKKPGEKGKGTPFPASVGKGDIFLYSPPIPPSLALTVVIFGSSFLLACISRGI